jgi:hypothetical protein
MCAHFFVLLFAIMIPSFSIFQACLTRRLTDCMQNSKGNLLMPQHFAAGWPTGGARGVHIAMASVSIWTAVDAESTFLQ